MTRPGSATILPFDDGLFAASLHQSDPELYDSIRAELRRQQDQIELIASENIVSRAVLEAQGSVLTNKYAEGYPARRYYAGCDHVDVAESLAIERAKRLFGCAFANVQPHSGAQANTAVMMALLKPGDTILGLSLAAGGHLTHGAAPALSGKWFNAVQYGVREDTHLIDYDRVAALAEEHRPKLIIAGGSAYPRFIDFGRFREIADSVGATLMVDMAHFAGLVAAGVHPSPVPVADITTTTTHKTLRGARGGMILTNDEALAKKINSAVFPGSQGGPLMHQIAGKAAAFKEALTPEFRTYCEAIVANAKALSARLVERGFAMVAGGTDTHLMLVDLRPKGVTGNIADESLERAGITCNKNAIPFDPEKPTVTSGIRLGSPAATTRGFGVAEFEQVGDLIADVLEGLAANPEDNAAAEAAAREKVLALCRRFPVYPGM
ncbi:MAG: serine hydroxymethyltransferase [Rhodospirillaceae bacterium]|nr:serine hydroxymethyltransferase [Rhodospirillaceae bacterium]MDE0617588.1 serine hydroxymethyltransferase [Rhodospirillaceae bacterium]